MKNSSNSAKKFAGCLLSLCGRREGSVTIEVALSLTVFFVVLLGLTDFGLAYSRQMEMDNAVRAGSQFALARRPSLGPGASSQVALTSLQTLRQAVLNSATFLPADPGSPALDVVAFCQCPDATPVTCAASGGGGLPCANRQTFVRFSMTLPYNLLFPYPAFGSSVTLQAANTVRLN